MSLVFGLDAATGQYSRSSSSSAFRDVELATGGEVSEGMDDLCEVNMGDKNEETSSQGKKKKKHDHIIDKLVAGMEKSADSLCTAINNVANTMGNPIHKRIVDDVNRELLNIHGGHHRR